MCAYTVYKHTSPSGKVYIGITSQKPESRWGVGGKGYRRNVYFGKAIQKYGWDNIKHEILFTGLSKSEAYIKETELISLYKSNNPEYGYNLSTGGEYARTGCPCSENTRKKISESLTGRHLTDEHRAKISKVHKRVPKSEEHRRKIGDAQRGAKNHMYGKHLSEATCRKMSQSRTGKPLSELHRKSISIARINNPLISRRVAQYSLDDEFIAEYPSLGEAERNTGVLHGNISKCCKGTIKTSGGFKWKYVE